MMYDEKRHQEALNPQPLESTMTKATEKTGKIEILKDGPYLVSGNLPLNTETIGTNTAGESVRWQKGPAIECGDQYTLCRCGHSANKPFCDGTHSGVGFDGTETASRISYRSQAVTFDGPRLSLLDAEELCAFARFCDPHGRVWNLVRRTDAPEARRNFLREVADCPAGRLVARDKETGELIEPDLSPSLALIEDPSQRCSGPVWVRGGVPVVGADGVFYELRNRVTLCRCGTSQNKPFCDGSHADAGFNANSSS